MERLESRVRASLYAVRVCVSQLYVTTVHTSWPVLLNCQEFLVGSLVVCMYSQFRFLASFAHCTLQSHMHFQYYSTVCLYTLVMVSPS